MTARASAAPLVRGKSHNPRNSRQATRQGFLFVVQFRRANYFEQKPGQTIE
jgi:hypothetical protein